MHAALTCIVALLLPGSVPAAPPDDGGAPASAWDEAPAATSADAESTAAVEQDGADPIPSLVAALRAESPYDAGAVIAADARYARLTEGERARLLEGLEEHIRWWAPLLNLYPGYGLGSLASRDRRGAWLAAADFTGATLFFAGILSEFGDSGSPGGAALLTSGAALIIGSRVAGVILPFTFSGRRHHEAERALRRLPPPITAAPVLLPVAPGRGAPGAALGVAFQF